MKTRAIILAAGIGKRFGSKDKVFIEVEQKPLIIWAIEPFEETKEIDGYLVVTREESFEFVLHLVKKYGLKKFEGVVGGGKERQDSVYNALKALPKDTETVLIHDAARPLVDRALIKRVLNGLSSKVDGVIPAIGLTDTIKWLSRGRKVGGTLNRDALIAVQTPQAFRFHLLLQAYERAYKDGFYGTDDASLVERIGGTVLAVEGSQRNIKVTTKTDLERVLSILRGESVNHAHDILSLRIGIGYDSHRLVEGRKLIIGGVEIPYSKGLLGHSDGDVLIHAVIDALLGAAGMGDIGTHFPDSEEKYRGISSMILLEETIKILHSRGADILWLDCTIFAEKPKMAPFIPKMRENLKKFGLNGNIKAKTNEGMGFVGKEEGIAAQAICLVRVKE